MLVNCKRGCKLDTTTNALLDVETDTAICEYCEETLPDISSYAKKAMKSNGDIVRKKKGKAFSFDCMECKKNVQVKVEDDKVVGSGCAKKECCRFNISDYMKNTIKMLSSKQEDAE